MDEATSSMSYKGDLLPSEAWVLLSQNRKAVLVDVRTQPEWSFVGVPNLTGIGNENLRLSWRVYPNMEVNPEFSRKIVQIFPDKETPLLFLCKTGGRSLEAACYMATMGYSNCYNIANGFEGRIDQFGHRSFHNGWKHDGLPWGQS